MSSDSHSKDVLVWCPLKRCGSESMKINPRASFRRVFNFPSTEDDCILLKQETSLLKSISRSQGFQVVRSSSLPAVWVRILPGITTQTAVQREVCIVLPHGWHLWAHASGRDPKAVTTCTSLLPIWLGTHLRSWLIDTYDQWSPVTPCVEGSGQEARQEEPGKFFFLVRSDSESQHPYQRESLKHKPEVPMLDTKASQISIKASSHRNGQSMDCECSWMSKTVPFSNWRRKWQPTPVFFPGKPRRQRNVVGYRPRACNEVDMTEQLTRALVSDHSICLTTLFILV